MDNRHLLCIDLKSFFASCECVERGIDPFSYPLVVANPYQGDGAITLAITPFLKAKGIKSRSRLFEIPKSVNYQIVPPRMRLYLKYSERVVSLYLDFVAMEDLYIYSIDECFLDVTSYLKLYHKTDEELALTILKKIEKEIGLTATCGIGPNMLLAKVAMDNDAKKYKNGIAKWTYDDVKTKLWSLTPLSKMWGIGKQMEKHLNNLGLFTIGEVAHYPEKELIKKFGIMGGELWNHTNGIDTSRISDFKVEAKDKSYSHSQVLMKNYDENNIKLIIKEMIEVLAERMRKNHQECEVIGFGIGYSKETNNHFYHSYKLAKATDDEKTIYDVCLFLFDEYYEDLPIRKVSISCGGLSLKKGKQLSLFEKENNHDEINKAIDEIKDKYGKNSLIKASNLLEDSTKIDRNNKIGGHHA